MNAVMSSLIFPFEGAIALLTGQQGLRTLELMRLHFVGFELGVAVLTFLKTLHAVQIVLQEVLLLDGVVTVLAVQLSFRTPVQVLDIVLVFLQCGATSQGARDLDLDALLSVI